MSEPDVPIQSLDREAISARLERVRERTLSLIAGLDWQVLTEQHVSILSPMVWDLGHIANFEELWLCQRLSGDKELHSDYAEMFDAVINPRPTRKDLLLPVASELLEYMSAVRSKTLETLERVDSVTEPDLVGDGLVYELVAEHEEQHQETLLQAFQILEDPSYVPAQWRRLPKGQTPQNEMIEVPEGTCTIGAPAQGFAYDNERGAHEVLVPGFYIDSTPVSCGDFERFVEDGGYKRPELWSEEGWRWRSDTGAESPANWRYRNGGWVVRSMGRSERLRADLPVTHVCYWESEAFSRWAGKRLPTETEWEKAALWDEARGQARPYPWGSEPPDRSRANLDQFGFGPAPVGAYPRGASAYGVEQMVGDVWEWTSSAFTPYPGFEAYPYREYSEIFFGDAYKVLRGGSWATRPAVARGTFRNWDFPIRRQIFAGFRCARSSD